MTITRAARRRGIGSASVRARSSKRRSALTSHRSYDASSHFAAGESLHSRATIDQDPCVRQSGVVIGREREIAEANGFLAEAAERSCGLLLVGEPGIGKTTIWSAVVDEALGRGFRVVGAQPSEAEAELAFAVLADLLTSVDDASLWELPGIQRTALEQALRRADRSSTVDPVAVALATLGALRSLSADSPLVIAVDDLQWVDAPSLRALTFAFRRLGGARVGLIATVRVGFDVELTRLAQRDASSIERIEIGGLPKRHLAQIVFERTGRTLSPPQLGRIAELSAGSPYYALELAAADAETRVPETLAVALRARLERVSKGARAAGLAAATLGRFDPAVTGAESEGGILELRAAGIVDERTGSLWFSHPLLASTLLDMYTAEERRRVHLSLAALVEDSDERALHLGRGTEAASEAVALELEQAADRQDARGAPETAAALAERAAALTPAGDVAARTRRIMRAADLYQAAGEGREHVYPSLEHLVNVLPPGPDRALVLVRLGWLGAMIDTITGPDAIEYQERALAEGGDAPDVAVAAHAVLARMRGLGGDYRAALRHAERAFAAAAATEQIGMFPSPTGELAIARFYSGHGLDEQLFEEGIEMEKRAGRVVEPYQSPKLQLAKAFLYTGQLSRARLALLELLDLSIELERVRSRAGCALQLTEVEARAGNLAQAEAYAAEFASLDRQLRGDLGDEWYPSGVVAMHLGRVDDARRILSAGVEYSRAIGSTIWLAHHLWALGQLELVVGDLAEARSLLGQLPQLLRETGLGEWAAHPFHPDLIETLVGLGEVEEAAELTGELEEYGRRLDRPWGLATAARSRALIASAHGETDEALEFAGRALAEHERLDWPLEHARTLLVTGGILRRLGRRRDAAATLAEARSAFVALRSPLWLARLEAEERRLGGRRGSGHELTPTEERVAELAGWGLRNSEIAAQLYVTPKTVEATLSRVYRKLGVRSRTELAGRLAASRAEDT
jgi:DNA-binding CsgD family transcriptional regulator